MNKTDLTERNYIRQAHTIVNAKMSLTKLEIDIILVLLTAIDFKDTDFKDYNFSIKELEEKIGHPLKAERLKKVIKSLMNKAIELPTKDNRDWEIVNWFSYFKYNHNGLISCRFDKLLKPFLLELKSRFIVSDLRMLLPMKSSYSKRMYLLLKEYSKIGKRNFDIEKLHELLKVPTGMKRYDNFKRQILQRAETDINKFTDLEVEFTEKKRSRKVIAVTYTIKKNHNDLKAFISYLREFYVNELLFHTKDKRPLKCSEKGLLYYADNNGNINQKESQKFWEYLHENRKELYIFKITEEEINEMKKNISLLSLVAFKEYLQENFVHRKIIRLKKSNTDEHFDLSIFPNGNLYDMSGESLGENSVQIWELLYKLAKNGKLKL